MSIGRMMAKGAAWMVAARMSDRFIGLISIMVLARVLVPADFGLVAMATSIIAMLEVIGNFGFEAILIQNQSAERRHYDTAWTCNVLFGLSCSLVLLGLAEPAAAFFRSPRLVPLVRVLAILPVLRGLQNIGIVEFQKQLKFDKEFLFAFLKKVSSFAVVVPLALVFRNYWALVIGNVAAGAAACVLSFVIQPYRPRFNLGAWRELFRFSKWYMLSGVLRVLLERAPELIVGRICGDRPLGLFKLSTELAYLPANEFAMPVNRASFPGYAKNSTDMKALRSSFLNVWSMICLFVIPASIGVCLTADLIVPLFLGSKWLDATLLVRILAIASMLAALQTNPSFVLLALGKPNLTCLTSAAFLGALLPLMAFATSRWGPTGAAWAYVAAGVAILPIRLLILNRHIDLRFPAIFARSWRPLLAAVAMIGAVLGLRVELPAPVGTAFLTIHAAVVVLTGATAYVGADLVLWRMAGSPDGGESFMLDSVVRKWEAWRNRRRARRASVGE